MSMLNRWNYTTPGAFAEQYGDDQSYRRAIAFLDGPGILEDWGCGAAWAKQFVKQATYRGIDGSPGFCDFQRDLTQYRSQADFILLRHVLEHNTEWRKVLTNALDSFRERLCIVIFTPWQETTQVIATNPNGTPDIGFNKLELYAVCGGRLRAETIASRTQYGSETLLYLERDREARLFRELQQQAALTGELEARPVGVRRQPVEEALKFLDLYWDHEHSETGLNPQRYYLEKADACLRDALNAEPRP